MIEKGIFSSVIERRTHDMSHLSHAAFDRKWGRYNVVYGDQNALKASLVRRLAKRSQQETERVVSSQKSIEDLLAGR